MISPLALSILSAAVLAYEVLLVRLFAIVQWHHFAFMAISVALLGFGVSGALIVLAGDRARRNAGVLFWLCAALFALTAPAAFLLAQQVPFNALEIVWEPGQLLFLAAIYLILLVPFTLGAGCIGLAFCQTGAVAGRVYFWNLLGSGVGALGIVPCLIVLAPINCLALIGALGLVAALMGAARHGAGALAAVFALGVLGAGGWTLAPGDWTSLRMSEFKGLTRALSVKDARVVAEASGPLALLSVVESPSIPFRHAPGLSLTAPSLPPAQLGVFADGAFAETIDLWDGDRDALAYLEYSTDALAYRLAQPRSVLILEAGGKREILQAIRHGVERIDAVEENRDMLRLVDEALEHGRGPAHPRPEAHFQITTARRFVTASRFAWDLVELPQIGAGHAATARGLREDFMLTSEGLGEAFQRLRPNGWLSATVEVDLPPRAALKLVSTLRAALAQQGIRATADHLIAIRGISTITVAVKRSPIDIADIDAARDFAASRGFDLVHFPGMPKSAANLRARLAEPVFFQGFRALLGPESTAFINSYKFDISAATDDRPFFHDVFKWTALPDLLALGPAGSAAFLELGELIVSATLVQALFLGAIFVLLPLRLRLSRRRTGAMAWRFGGYFAALGLAFLFIEVAWIHRFVLFLGHPLYSVAVVLTGFLVFAALGARASTEIERRLAARSLSALDLAVLGIVGISLLYHAALPGMLAQLSGLGDIQRVLITLALIAPLAVLMGMPFPLGLDRVSGLDPAFVPWAWGLNGCASVVSAAAATLISMHFGISATIWIAVGLYAAAAILLRPFAPVAGDV